MSIRNYYSYKQEFRIEQEHTTFVHSSVIIHIKQNCDRASAVRSFWTLHERVWEMSIGWA